MKELHYTFSVEYAEKYGLNEAIMLHNFIYWLNINKANNNNFINGRYWTYNSSKAFQKLFPFWTQKQIEYTLAKLVDAKILIKDCFNKDKRDRTAWYTLADDFFSECISQKKEMHATNLGNVISQKKEMYNITDKKQHIKNTDKNSIDTASGFSSQSNYSEIPNNSAVKEILTTQSNRQENLDSSTSEKSSLVQSSVSAKNAHTQKQFSEFWEAYGRKVAKPKAEQSFKKALSKASFEEIRAGVIKYNQYLPHATWLDKAHPTTWLNEERWNDDYDDLIKQAYKKSGKTPPAPQRTPEKQQEEVVMKEDAQRKREGVIRHLHSEEMQVMRHIKEILKTAFDVKFHGNWIDDFVFSCRNEVTYIGFTEQKHIDIVQRNLEKFKECVMREVAVFEGLNAERIELKLID